MIKNDKEVLVDFLHYLVQIGIAQQGFSDEKLVDGFLKRRNENG